MRTARALSPLRDALSPSVGVRRGCGGLVAWAGVRSTRFHGARVRPRLLARASFRSQPTPLGPLPKVHCRSGSVPATAGGGVVADGGGCGCVGGGSPAPPSNPPFPPLSSPPLPLAPLGGHVRWEARGASACACAPCATAAPPSRALLRATWLILPVVICLSQRLSHACLSISDYTVKLRMAH